MTYLSENFLLHTKSAETLYHDHARDMPIFDYHCHLSSQDIADDVGFATITQAWLKGDHYKWRAMRANGIDEACITGAASDEEKFSAWAATLSAAVRNPLFDWAHLELKRYFDIADKLLAPDSARSIYAACNERLKEKSFSARNLLQRMRVKFVGTTDDPVDDLAWHAQLKRDKFDVTVVPTFRPDKAGAIEDAVAFNAYLDRLSAVADIEIASFADLLSAIDKRHAYFHEHGCRCSDHGFETLSEDLGSAAEIASIFAGARAGKTAAPAAAAKFKAALLLEVCRMNHRRGWVQQLHFGIIRNTRSRLYKSLGPDAGVDCIGDYSFARPLGRFLDALDATGQLAKTILFNSNPKDNEMLACMAQAFQDGTVPGKIQLGPAWWFLDQKDGMVRHLNALSYFGLASRFVGMTTDSRSLLSFPRHEYFRRILCNLLGEEMERGDLPGDFQLIGSMVKDICFSNAKSYFDVDAH